MEDGIWEFVSVCAGGGGGGVLREEGGMRVVVVVRGEVGPHSGSKEQIGRWLALPANGRCNRFEQGFKKFLSSQQPGLRCVTVGIRG